MKPLSQFQKQLLEPSLKDFGLLIDSNDFMYTIKSTLRNGIGPKPLGLCIQSVKNRMQIRDTANVLYYSGPFGPDCLATFLKSFYHWDPIP